MRSTIRFASFLAPSMFPVYQFIADFAGDQLGVPTELITGASFGQFASGEVDVGFICGLPYVQLARFTPAPVEPLVAPVLQGDRFGGLPVYFSDVIVKRGQPFHSFAELRGYSWSFNDRDSQSGYGITRYWLARMGETGSFFGRVIEAGFHQRSIQLVCSGEVDASAIDCQVLAIEMRDHPDIADQIQVIDTIGPSTIQPVVAAARLPDSLKADLRAALLELNDSTEARQKLAFGFIERFARVTDEDYDDIRRMLAYVDRAGMMAF